MKTKLIVAIASMGMLSAGANAAVDAYIRFHYASPTGGQAYVPTESQSQYAKLGFQELKEFSFGAENLSSIGSATGGAGAGKVKFNEFTIKRSVDSASPALFKALASGAHFDYVDLAIKKASGGAASSSSNPYLIYRFKMTSVTKIDWAGPGDDGPMESITFSFGGLVMQYAKQKADGSFNNPVFSGWDQSLNKTDDGPFDIKS